MDIATEPTGVEIHLADATLAGQIRAWAEDNGENLTAEEQKGILPLLPIVLAGVMAVTAIANLIVFVRSKTQCQLLIDARYGEVRKEIDCNIRDGRVIVVSNDDVRVEIVDAPAALDFSEIVKAAAGGTATTVLEAATAAGVNALVVPA